jgi:hypothetical protein
LSATLPQLKRQEENTEKKNKTKTNQKHEKKSSPFASQEGTMVIRAQAE